MEATEAIDTDAVLRWYGGHARDLPWRRPDATPWAVLVIEVMLQQTPVARALPAYEAWLARWPTPGALATASPGEAVRQWGRLGYPRRGLRLHAAACVIAEEHGGAVPDRLEALLALPGVGAYTARAVAAFAFGQRQPVLDTNVRRVLARTTHGTAEPAPGATAAEWAAAEQALPATPETAVRLSAALMELGALVCTADRPRCADCPLAAGCTWRRAGAPDPRQPRRRQPPYAGSDRHARGALLATLRQASGPVPATDLTAAWSPSAQRENALAGLLADGLVEPAGDGDGFQLPD
jgi:A/G-specific adenine glycosylase